MLASCAASPSPEVVAASALGRIEAGVDLPDLPSECRSATPPIRAAARVGDETFSLLRRADRLIDRANEKAARCAAFYDSVRVRFAAPDDTPVK